MWGTVLESRYWLFCFAAQYLPFFQAVVNHAEKRAPAVWIGYPGVPGFVTHFWGDAARQLYTHDFKPVVPSVVVRRGDFRPRRLARCRSK